MALTYGQITGQVDYDCPSCHSTMTVVVDPDGGNFRIEDEQVVFPHRCYGCGELNLVVL